MKEVKLPEVGENVTSAVVANVLVQAGEEVTEGQPLLELESDKAVLEVAAPSKGKVQNLRVKTGDQVNVGDVVAEIEEDAGESEEPAPTGKSEAPPAPAEAPQKTASPAEPKPKEQAQQAPKPAEGQVIPASPSLRRMAREQGLDLNQVQGSGPAGRITPQDLSRPATPATPAYTLPDLARFGTVRREAMSGIRKATVRNMARAAQIPLVTNFDRADITRLEAERKRLAPLAPEVKLTLTALLVKLVAVALRAEPKFNAAIDEAASEIVYREYIHIGVAVDTENGLLVPVIREADRKGAFKIAAELADLAERARERKLKAEEMEGGGFSISNLGGIGGNGFTPLVNPPEVAILGVSRSEMSPVWNGESFVPKLMLPLALSYDHRLIDGADAARFLRRICLLVEDPLRSLLEG